VWVVQGNYLPLKNALHEEVKARFDAEGIEIPFPQRTFFPGPDAAPLRVRLVMGEELDRVEASDLIEGMDPEAEGPEDSAP
jgi:small-conductance mechanosensitive channel